MSAINEQEFVQRVRKASSLRQEEAVKDCRKQIVQAKKRHAELDGLVKKLYEANATASCRISISAVSLPSMTRNRPRWKPP